MIRLFPQGLRLFSTSYIWLFFNRVWADASTTLSMLLLVAPEIIYSSFFLDRRYICLFKASHSFQLASHNYPQYWINRLDFPNLLCQFGKLDQWIRKTCLKCKPYGGVNANSRLLILILIKQLSVKEYLLVLDASLSASG